MKMLEPGINHIRKGLEAGPSSLKEIKAELTMLNFNDVLAICMKLVKYRKENKELITYLLFEASDEQSYINRIKGFIDEQFNELNRSSLYQAKKGIQKVLRSTKKFIKFSGNKQTEVELLIYFLAKMKGAKLPLKTNKAIGNIYQRQILKITTAMKALHEDLQYDYSRELEPLVII